MLFPEAHIHLPVAFPVVGRRQERGCLACPVGMDPVQDQLMPFKQMNQNIPQVFVPLPVGFLFAGVP